MYDVVISMIFYDIGLEGEHITIYETSGSRHYRPTPSSAYGIIHLGPIFATRKVVAPFSNIQSSWADQYGSIDT